jgi:hypothetical protein
MSFIVSVDRKSQCPDAICKYEVHAYRPDAAWGIGPFDFELERKAILNDFHGLLPAIMASSTRFRSALKFDQNQEEASSNQTDLLLKKTDEKIPLDIRL